jgi:hypothetical protein
MRMAHYHPSRVEYYHVAHGEHHVHVIVITAHIHMIVITAHIHMIVITAHKCHPNVTFTTHLLTTVSSPAPRASFAGSLHVCKFVWMYAHTNMYTCVYTPELHASMSILKYIQSSASCLHVGNLPYIWKCAGKVHQNVIAAGHVCFSIELVVWYKVQRSACKDVQNASKEANGHVHSHSYQARGHMNSHTWDLCM